MSCVISKSQGITINGSNKAFGHVTQSASFNFSFGDAPSTASITLVKNPSSTSSGSVDLLQNYEIGFGNLTFNMKAMSAGTNNSATNANTLTIEFADTSIDYLDQYYIALNREQLQAPSPSPHLIGLGEKYGLKKDIDGFGNVSPAGSRAYINLALNWATRNMAYSNAAGSAPTPDAAKKIQGMIIGDFQKYIDNADGTSLYMADEFFSAMNSAMPGKVTQPPQIAKGSISAGVQNLAVQVDAVGATESCPNYMSQFMSQFQSQSSNTINVVSPMLVLEEKGEFVNYTGTVREVLAAFARDYGLIFYWDPTPGQEKVVWVDGTAGVSATFAKAQGKLLSGSCSLLSSSSKEDKSQTYARGAMGQFDASKDGAETDNKRLGSTRAELISFNNFQFTNCLGNQSSLQINPSSWPAPPAASSAPANSPQARQQQALQQRQAAIAQGLAARAAANRPGSASNDGFIEAMKAAALGSKFYGMYVFYKMIAEGAQDLIQGRFNADHQAIIEKHLEGNGDEVGQIQAAKLVPKFIKPPAIVPNDFITQVYGGGICPAGSPSQRCEENDFDDDAINLMEEEIVKFRKKDPSSVFTNSNSQNKGPATGQVTIPGVKYSANSPKAGQPVKLSFSEVIDILNSSNPAIGCICLTGVDKKYQSQIFKAMLNNAAQDGHFRNQMHVEGQGADNFIFALLEKNSAKSIFSKSVDASNDQMYNLLKAFGKLANRYYILKKDSNSKVRLRTTTKNVKNQQGRNIKKGRSYNFLFLRESAQNERSYAIPSGASVKGINPYLRADQDNPFKDLFMALLKMTYGNNPQVGTTSAGGISEEDYPSVVDFIAGLLEMSKTSTQSSGKSPSLEDLFVKFTPTYTAKELAEKREMAEAACNKLEDDIVMFLYDTQAAAPDLNLSEAVGKAIKKAEDGIEPLNNSRTSLITNAFQALINSGCGFDPFALRNSDPVNAIPPTLNLPALKSTSNPSSMKLLYAFGRKAQYDQQDGYFKTSAVHFPSIPSGGVAKVEMDLGVTISPEQLGYADSTFSQLTQQELLGNGYSAFFQAVIAGRLQNEVAKKVQVNGEASVSYTYRFAATQAAGGGVNFPSIPGPADGLESLSLSVGDTMEISVTIGSKRKQESAARMRNSRIDLIGGSSSVQTISTNPSAVVLPPSLRALS